MYTVDKRDKVLPLSNVPQSSVGAPCPLVLSDEHTTVVAYYIQEDEIDFKSNIDPLAIITFRFCKSTMFGPPNDEAFRGHPLSSRGLEPYSAFIVKDSSWLRRLIKMNEVHPYHNLKLFEGYKHFILSFHDSTFECIAQDFEVEIVAETFSNAIALMKEKLK
ncbi:MAG: hypothetical protein ABGX20_23355 [Bacillus sp. (in: firmicutes)]